MVDRGRERRGSVGQLLSLENRHTDLSFSELRRRVLRRLPEAWRQFVERYSRTVYAFSLRLAAGDREREEVAQQVYLGVFQRLADHDYRVLRSFRGDAKFETYLFTVVRNEVARLRKREVRKERRFRAYEEHSNDDTEQAAEESAAAPGFAESVGLDASRVARIVDESLARLDGHQRLVLRLRFTRGLSYRQLAGLFGWKDTNAAAYEVTKALRKLDILGQCRETMRWGEPEREVLLGCLRRWLERSAPSKGGR